MSHVIGTEPRQVPFDCGEISTIQQMALIRSLLCGGNEGLRIIIVLSQTGRTPITLLRRDIEFVCINLSCTPLIPSFCRLILTTDIISSTSHGATRG